MNMSEPAVFLDRDGVLTIEKGYISKPAETEIYDYAGECINALHKKGFLCIVITNQSGVARGLFSEEELIGFNNRLKAETGVDAIYYCPHYKSGIVTRYNIECDCRKPGIGMIKRACKEYEIDLSNSWIIGDRETDILTGVNAGITNLALVKPKDGPDRMIPKGVTLVEDLRDFVNLV